MNNDLAANALTFDNGYDDLFRLHDATKEGISKKKICVWKKGWEWMPDGCCR